MWSAVMPVCKGQGEVLISEAAATPRTKNQAGLRDAGSSRACISWGRGQVHPRTTRDSHKAPTTVSIPSETQPSLACHRAGQIWPEREGQARASRPPHTWAQEGAKPPPCLTGSRSKWVVAGLDCPSKSPPVGTKGGTLVGAAHCLVYYQFLRTDAGTKFRVSRVLFS